MNGTSLDVPMHSIRGVSVRGGDVASYCLDFPPYQRLTSVDAERPADPRQRIVEYGGFPVVANKRVAPCVRVALPFLIQLVDAESHPNYDHRGLPSAVEEDWTWDRHVGWSCARWPPGRP